jgi:TonB family protein
MKFSQLKRRNFTSLIISVSLHVLVLCYFLSSQTHLNSKIATIVPAKREIKHSIDLSQVRVISPKELKAIKDNLKRQIVATDQTGKKERPLASRFSGASDQVFDRQTMASKNGSFKEAGLGKKDGVQELKTDRAEDKKVADSKKLSKAKNLTLSDLGSFTINLPKEDKKEKIEKTINASQGIAQGDKKVVGLAQNNDFVEDIALGDTTNLNTTENKYYGFYHRIRQRLEQYWGSSIQSKAKHLYKAGRRIPASENLITAITVTLDVKGNILDIKIDGTSGIKELDQAAIESFNKAGPFPNPPKGLLVDGRAVIQWGFVVKS